MAEGTGPQAAPPGRVRAVVFDFDGMLLETEEPLYQAWREIFEAHGATLTLEEWAVSIGGADRFDPVALLASRTGQTLDGDDITRRRQARRDALLAERALSHGVMDYLDEAAALGLRVGVASSSSRRWVEGHLRRLGALDRFEALACFDDVGVTKPAPDAYVAVLARLGVPPDAAVAFEDSQTGLRAAKAAGMRCVVVPTVMTQHMDFRLADRVLERLGEVPLAQLLAAL